MSEQSVPKHRGGRPRLPETRAAIHLRLPRALLQRIDAVAAARGLTRTGMVEFLLGLGLAALDEEPEETPA